MSNRPHVYPLQTTADVPESAANTETVVATLPNVCSELPNATVTFAGSLMYTSPAAITSLTVRVRRDSLTGTIVGEAMVNATDIVASKGGPMPFAFIDQPGGTFMGSYVLTVQGAGEGGPGTCTQSTIVAIVS